MNALNQDCYCSSKKPFSDCCEPLILGVRPAESAEELMRSRFSAFCLGRGDYLMQTHHPDFVGELTAEKLSKSSNDWQWTQLDILESRGLSPNRAMVKFNAWYLENDQLMCHREMSQFELYEGAWRYTKGEFSNGTASSLKLGRNEACPCGSGRKYKKCHQNVS